MSSNRSLDDEDGGGRGSCEDPEASEAPRASKAPMEGGGGGRDLEGVLGEYDLFRRLDQICLKLIRMVTIH
ncbi:hypothetical protein Tco_1419463 [Tanacetum coccineum]